MHKETKEKGLKMKTQICILANCLCEIGGIETFVYNYCGMLKDDYSIIVAVTRIANKQLRRLRKIVKVVENTTPIECDTLIVMHIGTRTIPENIKFKTKIQMIHGCKSIAYGNIPEADIVVPVSEAVIKSFGNELEGKNVKAILNPINELEKPNTLKLVSCTRLTEEKGYNRMIKLANQLQANGIPYIWFVLTNQKVDETLFTPMKPRLDIETIVSMCDYLVQLSDTESFCYSIVEALNLHVPVITTPIEPIEEIGVVDGLNGWVLPFDMKDIDVAKIYNTKLTFDYNYSNEQIKKQWCKLLGKAQPFVPYEEETMKVKVLKTFRDATNKLAYVKAGTIYECDVERADKLQDMGLVVKILEAKKEEKIVEVERATAPEEKEVAVVKKVAAKKPATKKVATKKATK